MSDITISFDLKIFYPNTKFLFTDVNENFSIIDMLMDEQDERMSIIEAMPK